MIPLFVLLAVFVLISVRQVGNIRFQIWQIMLLGAVAVLVTGQITLASAVSSVNLDVILFLFGMFAIGHAMEESGYLSHISYKIFRRANSVDSLLLYILFVMGFASAFLMNDTLAIIGTPVVLLLAKKHDLNPKLLLLALAFAITIGSVMSPIGNPQNLLIAVNGEMPNPFVTFFVYLMLPTVINLLVAYALLKLFYRNHFHKSPLNHSQEPIKNHGLARLSRISLILVISLVLVKISIVFLGIQADFRLTYIALISALPILLFSPMRVRIVRGIDWHTIIFFVAMFILMESVWESGVFQSLITASGVDITSVLMILLVGVLLSQLISNVPLVALYLPMLLHAGASTKEMVALAVGSTIAGNLLILGAASNIIIIQNAEKRSGNTIGFVDFAKIGIPLTILNISIYWIFLVILR
ncbi:MAG: anion transporter [Candidatus Altiarchaeota archaeon]|nr:anion transporter [Candidatus Altiarchaeota archaeon]